MRGAVRRRPDSARILPLPSLREHVFLFSKIFGEDTIIFAVQHDKFFTGWRRADMKKYVSDNMEMLLSPGMN